MLTLLVRDILLKRFALMLNLFDPETMESYTATYEMKDGAKYKITIQQIWGD